MNNSGQSEFFRPQDYDHYNVTIVGCGAIGSSIGELLTRVGFKKFTLIDFDTVEDKNLANQLYFDKDLGAPKVEALKNKMLSINPTVEVDDLQDKILPETEFLGGNIVIAATDNMEARKNVFELVKKEKPCLFIDGRMGGLLYNVYTVNPKDDSEIEFYEKKMFSDEEATEETCSSKPIIFNTFGIGAEMTNQITKFLNKQNYYKEIIFSFVDGQRLQIDETNQN